MKKSELQEMIRLVVREEIEKSLPQYLMEVLAEKISGGQAVISETRIAPTPRAAAPAPKAPSLTPAQLEAKRRALVGLDGPMKQPATRAPAIVTNNPILNEVLSQTQGGVPTEEEVAAMAPSVLDKVAVLNESTASENPAIAAVAGALTRNYSALIKAADEKAKRGRP